MLSPATLPTTSRAGKEPRLFGFKSAASSPASVESIKGGMPRPLRAVLVPITAFTLPGESESVSVTVARKPMRVFCASGNAAHGITASNS